MPSSKGKAFPYMHCWELLKKSEKWKVRDNEAPPKRGAFSKMEDEDDDDEAVGGRNKNKPDGTKMVKEKIRRDAEASSLKERIDNMVKSNEICVAKTLEQKKELEEKKAQEKLVKWQHAKAEGLRKAAIEEKKALAEEKRALAEDKRANAEETKAMAKLLAEENRIMSMNRDEMDEVTLEWHNLARMEILERRRKAATGRGHAVPRVDADGAA